MHPNERMKFAKPITEEEFPSRGYKTHGQIRNYHPNRENTPLLNKVPYQWKSKPGQPLATLAYITDAEKELLKQANVHQKPPSALARLQREQNIGPHGILSMDDSGGPGGGAGSGGGNGDGPDGSDDGGEDSDSPSSASSGPSGGNDPGTGVGMGDDTSDDNSLGGLGTGFGGAGPAPGGPAGSMGESSDLGVQAAIGKSAASLGMADPTSFAPGFKGTLQKALTQFVNNPFSVVPGVTTTMATPHATPTNSFSILGALAGALGPIGTETAMNAAMSQLGISDPTSFSIGPSAPNAAPTGTATASTTGISTGFAPGPSRAPTNMGIGTSPSNNTGALASLTPSTPQVSSPTPIASPNRGFYSFDPQGGYRYTLA